MLVRRHNSEERVERPVPEPLAVRKRRQATEGSEAMRDYLRAQDAARERLRVLREERIERGTKRREKA
jgi:hypothetical protein